MKKIVAFVVMTIQLFATAVTLPIESVSDDKDIVYVKLPSVDIGLSGVVVHTINDTHSIILKRAEVLSFDKEKKLATIQLSEYNELQNDALPKSEYQVSSKDHVVLAIAYKRALLIAPTEEIYHKVTKRVQLEWVDSDFFATFLSAHGHPTPLIEDFRAMSDSYSVGLFIIYLNNKLYTVDAQSFKILSESDALFDKQAEKMIKLPFYSHIDEIEANWFGEGSSELKAYAPYYKALLKEYNPNKIK